VLGRASAGGELAAPARRAAGAATSVETGVPQSGQKRKSAASVAPHDEHVPATGVPQT
jgi:hypothetical protein